jgi:hypothetical protein
VAPFAIVHANDLDTLPAAWLLLARSSKARLVYDAHELYADFEVDPPHAYHAALILLERALARPADAVVTVSDALASTLEHRYALPRPLVVLNLPELDPRPPAPTDDRGALRVVYQGSSHSGRPSRGRSRATAPSDVPPVRARGAGASPARRAPFPTAFPSV